MWLLLTLSLAILIPRIAVKEMRPIARNLEAQESAYADQVRATVHGALEAELYGYIDEVIGATNKLAGVICVNGTR